MCSRSGSPCLYTNFRLVAKMGVVAGHIMFLTGKDKVSQHNWLDFNIDITKNNT